MDKSFSERIGIVDAAKVIQLNEMNEALTNSIWNLFYRVFDQSGLWHPFAVGIAAHFRKTPIDEVPEYNDQCLNWMKKYFFSQRWNKRYELLEFTAKNIRLLSKQSSLSSAQFEILANRVLKQEASGYRLVSGVLLPISNDTEIAQINDAVELARTTGVEGAREHLQTAIALLSKKTPADYRNSIKESISSVESVAKILSKENSQGLRGALDALGKQTKIHGSLIEGFIKLYGYTSNEDGIRHAITTDDQNVGFDETKYMLVSCSAFVNYLISKGQAAKIL